MRLDQRSILAAVGQVLREQRDEQRKVTDELRTRVAALEAKIDALEQRGSSSRILRAVPPAADSAVPFDKDSMIA